MSDNLIVMRMDAFGRDVTEEAAEVFVDGYYDQLCFFTKDKEKLKAAFSHALRPEMFYLAEADGEIVGILGCAKSPDRAMPLDRDRLRAALGFFKGGFAYRFLKGDFNTPLTYKRGTAYIESVATKEKARGQGVCSALFEYVMHNLPYRRYVLEVVNTNEKAIRLYQKLGFREFERKPEKNAKYMGFDERVLMEWRK